VERHKYNVGLISKGSEDTDTKITEKPPFLTTLLFDVFSSENSCEYLHTPHTARN